MRIFVMCASGFVGFVPLLVAIARERSVSAYVDDGFNRWPAQPGLLADLDGAHYFERAALA